MWGKIFEQKAEKFAFRDFKPNGSEKSHFKIVFLSPAESKFLGILIYISNRNHFRQNSRPL